MFRFYLFRFFLTPILFCFLAGLIWGIIFLVSVLLQPIDGYYKRKKLKKRLQALDGVKSLSYSIKSTQEQKKNFRLINFIFAKSKKLKRVFKIISINLDTLGVETGGPEITDRWGDPSYSSSISNLYSEEWRLSKR
jgi:hypothetical protein